MKELRRLVALGLACLASLAAAIVAASTEAPVYVTIVLVLCYVGVQILFFAEVLRFFRGEEGT